MAVGVKIVSDFDAKGIRKAITDFNKLEGAGNKSTFALRTFDKGLTNGLKNLAKFGAAVGAVAGVVGFKLVSAAYESQKVLAQTEAIIKSTGSAAGVTATGVAKLSEKLSMQIGVDDELIQKSANLLLTFKQVQNQVGLNNNIFDQAVTLSQDLGNVFGSADAAAMQLGKALSDPEKGITALRRAGINFTEQQKEQIRTLVASGDVLGAQKLILAEVESQVGGTAAASATGFDKMRVALGNVAEKFGGLLIPIVERFATFVIENVVPYLNRLADVIGEEGVGGGIKMLATDFLSLTTNMGKFGNTMLVLIAAFVAFRLVAIAAAISQTLFNVALLSNPIGIAVAAFIAIGVAVVAAYIKFEGFRKVVNAVINFIIGYVENLVNSFIKGINLIIDGINLLIKAANFFGAGLPELSKIGEVSFGRIGTAAQKASEQIFKTIDLIRQAKNAERMGTAPVFTTPSFTPPAGGGGGGESPIEKAKKALEKYTDAIKGVTQAQRSLKDANKSLNESNKNLLDKTNALREAQRKFNLITNGYGSESKQAKDADKERGKAQRGLERANYGLEQAVFAVKDAEKALADLRKDPEATPQAIRQAEISLAEAKLSVADATDSQRESTQSLTEAQLRLDEAINGAKEGSETFKDAVKELEDAQKAEADALDSVTAALERQADAVRDLAEAEKERRDAGKGISAADRKGADAAADDAVTGGGGGGGGGGYQFTQKELDDLAAIGRGDFGIPMLSEKEIEELFKMFPPIFMANGGVVTKATNIIAGERGAEAIIPLDRMGSFGSTYNISVTAGMGADGKDIGTQIVNALKRYERTNGALPLTVA